MEMLLELAEEHHVIDSGCSLYIKMIYVGLKWGSAMDPVTTRQR